jgi:hypothetical protein
MLARTAQQRAPLELETPRISTTDSPDPASLNPRKQATELPLALTSIGNPQHYLHGCREHLELTRGFAAFLVLHLYRIFKKATLNGSRSTEGKLYEACQTSSSKLPQSFAG